MNSDYDDLREDVNVALGNIDAWRAAAEVKIRTLDADLVMCREQLAQETERAESYRPDVAAIRGALDAPDDADVNQLIDVVHAIAERAEKAEKMATSPGSPLVQQADTYRRILAHSAIYTHTCIAPGRVSMSDQIIARLDELAAAESERDEWRDRALQSTDYEQQHGAQLPIPDATNPAHLQWTARMIELAQPGGDLPYRASQRNILAEHLRADADRLEAAQQQADADEELIEKAARTLAFAVERNDDDVSESEMWGMYLTPESRFRYRNQASALLAANLLRDGDQKAESGPTVEGGISNGQLLAMEPERREEVIASLSLEVRRKLANIASLGASRLISSVIADRDDWRTRNRMTSARDFTELAANLLRDGGEK